MGDANTALCRSCLWRGGWEDPEEGQFVTCACVRNKQTTEETMDTIWLAGYYSDPKGRGPLVWFAAFPKKEDAVAAAKARGPDGYDYVAKVPMYKTLGDFGRVYQDEVRKKALSKLTDEERRALGVS